MAENTGLRNNALPYPVYGAPYGIVAPILDADGDLTTGAASLDSEVSKNGDTFADCTNEAAEIATSSGLYSLLLTATEMTADVVAVIIKTGTAGAKTTPLVLYPRKLVTLRSGTAQAGAAGTMTLDSGASAIDDYYNGCLIVGTLDSAVEARIITDYVGSTKVASVTPNWNTTPDSDDTFIVYLPEGLQVQDANATHFGGAAGTFASGRPEVNTSHISGTAQTANDVGADVNEILTDTGTTLQAELDGIQADTEDIQSRIPTALVGGRIDATVDATGLEAGALALINTEVDTALADYDAPTRAELTTDINSVLARLIALGLTTGTVTTDGGNSATSFETDLSQTADDYWKDAFLLLTSGAMAGQVKRVTAYNGTTKFITVSGGFTATPADGVSFTLINR